MWRYVLLSRLLRFFHFPPVRNKVLFPCNPFTIGGRISIPTLLFPPALFGFVWPFTRRNDTSGEVDSNTIQKRLFGQSLLYIELGDYAQANSLLNELLHHLHTEYQNRNLIDLDYVSRRARVCSELANLNLLEGKLEPAESLLKQTIQDCITSGLLVTSAEIVELSLKLALIYDRLGRDEEAHTGFRFCISTQESKMSSQNLSENTSDKPGQSKEDWKNEAALLGMACNYYAKFLFSHGDSLTALGFAERSLELANQLYPADHPNCIHLLSTLGVLHADCAVEGGKAGAEGTRHVQTARDYLNRAYLLAKSSFDAISHRGESAPAMTQQAGSLTHLLTEWAVIEARLGQLATARQLIGEAESVLQVADPATSGVYRRRVEQVKQDYSL